MTTKKLQASFRLNEDHVLELTSVKEFVVKVDPEAAKVKEGDEGKKETDKEQSEAEEALLLSKELNTRLTAFQTYSFLTPYIQVLLRAVIICFAVTLLIQVFREFIVIVSSHAEDQKSHFKTNSSIVKFCIRFLLASIKTERRLMIIFLMSVLPLCLVCYGYLVAFMGSLYGAVYADGFSRIERDFQTDLATLMPGKDLKKRFWVERLESCSVRLDSVLGYAATVPLLNFLILFEFKTIPVLPLSSGLIFLALLLIDELLMKKRKFDVDSIFNSIQMDIVISGVGISWIFFIR